jgi:hypothetical protein
MMNTYPRADFALMALVALCMILTIALSTLAPDTFTNVFAIEDGPVEYGTAVGLLLGSIALLARIPAGTRRFGRVFAILTGLYALLFFFAAGEEISWGQRLFGLESPDYFLRHNDQSELTLHNMRIGDLKLDELVFGNILSVVLLSYLIALPLTWDRWAWVRSFCRRLAVPVPHKHHALATLIVTLIITVIDAGRKWEVYEFAFAAISLGIFLNPRERLDPQAHLAARRADSSDRET